MHFEQRKILSVTIKAELVSTYKISRSQALVSMKNGKGYTPTTVRPARNHNVSALVIGPGRYFHNFRDP